jgi:putative transposase
MGRAGLYRRRDAKETEEGDMDLRDEIHRIALEMPGYGRWRRFAVTTEWNHGHAICPNVAATLQPAGVDSLWIADITYIRLGLEFVYLAVILDAFSRLFIGWSLHRTLEADTATSALRTALNERQP